MTYCRMYVGNLDGFDWNAGGPVNVPRALTPDFPRMRPGQNCLGTLIAWAGREGAYCARTDLEAYVARVTKAQVVRFITDHYDADPAYTDPARMLYWEGRAYQVESLKELKEKVAALDDSREYGLVSECAS